ncbi:hypothetical protein DNTS_034152 [Danionella cerebrum]|uniref:Cadherin domain-containing protein n=1 Tax=Danionella cerebrum TaxID=2873325 RepID=A0A553N0A3_9TELE|nr:hypothetical protein DNTS_034152 [Danionella translucida]
MREYGPFPTSSKTLQIVLVINVKDVNDNAPKFTSDPNHVSIFQNTQPGTYVTRLEAFDADTGLNAKIHSSIEDSTGGLFSVEQSSGIISLESSLGEQATHVLRVRAIDQGYPHRLSSVGSVLVPVLDANNKPPVFEHRGYICTVLEDIKRGSKLLSVFAANQKRDLASQTTYTITSGNKKGAFRLDSQTGDIFVMEPLDYESASQHVLTVKATVTGKESLSDTATVTIRLLDLNDNSPAFSQKVYSSRISEDAKLGSTVLTVLANDIDGPLNNQIHYSIEDSQTSQFVMDGVSGDFRLSRQLDREQVKSLDYSHQQSTGFGDINTLQDLGSLNYDGCTPIINDCNLLHLHSKVCDELLHILVSDSGTPSLTPVMSLCVLVVKKSRFPPSILPLDVVIITLEDFRGTLGKIHATDQDEHDMLTFSLEPQSNSLFSVVSTDGTLLAPGGLDEGYYKLNVSVTDGHFSASARVSVNVLRVKKKILDSSVAVRFAAVTAEDFLQEHWRRFQKAQRSGLGARRSAVQMLRCKLVRIWMFSCSSRELLEVPVLRMSLCRSSLQLQN